MLFWNNIFSQIFWPTSQKFWAYQLKSSHRSMPVILSSWFQSTFRSRKTSTPLGHCMVHSFVSCDIILHETLVIHPGTGWLAFSESDQPSSGAKNQTNASTKTICRLWESPGNHTEARSTKVRTGWWGGPSTLSFPTSTLGRCTGGGWVMIMPVGGCWPSSDLDKYNLQPPQIPH